MIGVGAAGVGTWPLAWALRQCGQSGPTLGSLTFVLASATVAWGVYALTLALEVPTLTSFVNGTMEI